MFAMWKVGKSRERDGQFTVTVDAPGLIEEIWKGPSLQGISFAVRPFASSLKSRRRCSVSSHTQSPTL